MTGLAGLIAAAGDGTFLWGWRARRQRRHSAPLPLIVQQHLPEGSGARNYSAVLFPAALKMAIQSARVVAL